MDLPPGFPSGRSPKRELLGPRPTPLKVSKESHKIKKPPVAPQPHHAPPQQQQQQPRPPVIIYAVSPKIIHAEPNEFMSLVQRLTGQASSSSAATSTGQQQQQQPCSSSSLAAFPSDGGAMSPAALFACIEKTRTPTQGQQVLDENLDFFQGIEIGSDVQIGGSQFPGILSPNPNFLPSIPRNIFSPDSTNHPLNLVPEFSPFLQYSARNQQNQFEDVNNFSIFPSPSTFLSPQINFNSPSTLNLLRSLFDI